MAAFDPRCSSRSSSSACIVEAQPAFDEFGVFGFIFSNDWVAVARTSSAPCRCVVGTLITSAIALVIGVPIAVAAAVYVTELCPRAARASR